ncbi:mannosyltransferase family protein [Streptomyces griseus]|uniref:mannosyltransferase family protein n=1 Tax=Streptomyces griseus TaxID=1911 RepID=UPI0008404780|nr:mannosyltransferase family protein [Streptomyces griseus]
MSATSSRPRESAPVPERRPVPDPPPAGDGTASRPWAPRALLDPADRQVLWLYLLTRVAVWGTAYAARRVFTADRGARHSGSVASAFEQWDWGHFLHIARDGYFPGRSGPWTAGWDHREAFFPGFPLVLRAVHTVIPDWTAAGLLVSFVSGGVAVLALARIARLHLAHQDVGRRAVLMLLCSPCAVFLAAGYTESLFLALALPAWLAARRHHWVLAGTLTALATTVRVSGLFLAAALLVHFLLSKPAHRRPRHLPWLALPALPVVAYSSYLHAHTGDWMAWKHAQEAGWYRTFHTPWEAWGNTWNAAFGHAHGPGYAFMSQVELAAMVVGVLLFGLLVRQRRPAEALYVALSLCALGTSYWYTSVPRATLLWWPLWITVAVRSLRTPRFLTAYLCLAAPLTTVFALAFLSGRWAG